MAPRIRRDHPLSLDLPEYLLRDARVLKRDARRLPAEDPADPTAPP